VWALDQLPPSLTADRDALLAVPRIGTTIAELIVEFLETDEVRRLSRLLEILPIDARRLSRLPRMSSSRLRNLKSSLLVETAADLVAAIESGAVAALPGIGTATASLWHERLTEVVRPGLSIQWAVAYAERLIRHLGKHVPHLKVEEAGGVARLEEWVDVVDLWVNSSEGLIDFLRESALVEQIQQRPLRAMTLLGPVKFTKERSSVTSYGLQNGSLRGDLHLHSDWSPDGRQTLATIVETARSFGWEYIAITDHGEGLRFGGLDVEAIRRQHESIVALRERYPDIVVLHGAELNIDRNGAVDFPDEVLEELDFRLAAVHSHFGLEQAAQTGRLLAAIGHPLLHGIAHLTGRRGGVRPPIDLDLDAVFAACAAHSTALEVNGHLDRLDVSAANARRAAALGANFIVNSDAHRPAEMRNVFNGVKLLQNAGVSAGQVVNTWDVERFQTWLALKTR
jgi:histidinol phosphatase-like PHP family hydrolase